MYISMQNSNESKGSGLNQTSNVDICFRFCPSSGMRRNV